MAATSRTTSGWVLAGLTLPLLLTAACSDDEPEPTREPAAAPSAATTTTALGVEATSDDVPGVPTSPERPTTTRPPVADAVPITEDVPAASWTLIAAWPELDLFPTYDLQRAAEVLVDDCLLSGSARPWSDHAFDVTGLTDAEVAAESGLDPQAEVLDLAVDAADAPGLEDVPGVSLLLTATEDTDPTGPRHRVTAVRPLSESGVVLELTASCPAAGVSGPEEVEALLRERAADVVAVATPAE